MKNNVKVNSETSKEEVFNVAKKLIDEGTYVFTIENESETLLSINAFFDESNGKYTELKEDGRREWMLFCRENPDLWKRFNSLTAEEFKRLAKEQLDEDEYYDLPELYDLPNQIRTGAVWFASLLLKNARKNKTEE